MKILQKQNKIVGRGDATFQRGDDVVESKELWKLNIDRILAAAGLVLFLPVGVATAVWCAGSGEGVFYRQERIGKGGRPFTLYKFRTMRKDAPVLPRSSLYQPERYYIPGGAFLRSSGLDELPQLWCVLKGEMSLVGPRPLLAGEKEVHRLREQAGVYALRPGITGLAQLCGDPPGKIKAGLDEIYLKEHNLRLDGCILLSTVRVVLKRRKHDSVKKV